MKKILLTLLAVAGSLATYADVLESTQFYSEDFIAMGKESDYPTDGWLTLGNGAIPKGEIPQSFFNADGKGPYYVLLDTGSECYAMTNTIFQGDVAADEWLISPEIEMAYDDAVISTTLVGYCANGQMEPGKSPIAVYISEGGTEKDDFKQVGNNSVQSITSKELNTKIVNFPVNGYKGKKVRFAFVVTGTKAGFVGFSNISVAQYAINFVNKTNSFFRVGDKVTITLNPSMRTPVACKNVKVELEIGGNIVATENVEKDVYVSSTSATLKPFDLSFKDVYTIDSNKSIPYRLIVTPDFEGAVPSVLSSDINVVEKTYPTNVVMEEGTSVGCQFCPIGVGSIAYYHDTYGHNEEGRKFIPIAVHGGTYADPMEQGVRDYATSLNAANGAPGYPQAMFNRSETKGMPYGLAMAERAWNTESYTKCEIKMVAAPKLAEEELASGKKLDIHYRVYNGYSSTASPLNASIVLLENNVKGNNSSYNQDNAFWNRNIDFVDNYDPKLRPYMVDYFPGGKYAVNPIPFGELIFDHVARLIFPSFAGTSISSAWEADVPQDFVGTIVIPETVSYLQNTDVVVIITDPTTGKIVASDIMSAENYDTSGVNEVADNVNIIVRNEGGNLVVSGADNGIVEVYGIDGGILGKYILNGNLNVTSYWNGLVVVKVSTAEGAKTVKLIF